MNKEFINGHYKIIDKNYLTPLHTTNFNPRIITLINICPQTKPYDSVILIQKVFPYLKSPIKTGLTTYPATTSAINNSI